MMTMGRAARFAAPFLVSGGLLAFLLAKIDLGRALERVSLEVALVLLPALLLYGAVSLALEAVTLLRLIAPSRARLGLMDWARIKAASYPLYLVHYGLGGAALSLLLRRRAGLVISEAVGIVVLVALFDLVMVLLVTATGAALLSTQAPAIRAGVIAATGAGIAGGLTLLRLPGSLGPLEWVRSLPLFRVARTARWTLLAELALLRLLFVGTFVALGWCALVAFGISVPVGDMVVNIATVALVAALPIAVSGLGTGQAAFVYLFRHWATPETLLACSLTLSAGLIVLRAGLGFLFAGELTRETLGAARPDA